MSQQDPDLRHVRYAVVGLGWIAQTAVLPAFAHARSNSRLAALVSDDEEKLRKLSKRYGVKRTASYAQLGRLLRGGGIDAVYIATPNDTHQELALKAIRHGVHVLCEKPLAVTDAAARRMISSARSRGVHLMTAYRLHFEKSNLTAIAEVRAGRIGEPRFFSSTFSMQVEDPDNIRLQDEHVGGGPVYDLGIYCVNAARNLFGAEPTEVVALGARKPGDPCFLLCDEMVGAILRFPGDRVAQFLCSFGAAPSAAFDVVGTKGSLRLEEAYHTTDAMTLRVHTAEKKTKRRFAGRDQFAPELVYFSKCVLEGRRPEPSGQEGLADVRVIQAILRSARRGRSVRIEHPGPGERKLASQRPTLRQEIHRPPVREPELVGASAPGD